MPTIKLQELRKRSNINQTELAHQMGVDASLISRWENGEREPSFSQKMDLARLLGVTVDYLVNGRLQVELKFRASTTLKTEEKQDINKALTDVQQQLHFIDEAYRKTGKPAKPLLSSIDISGQQWEEAAAQIRDLLRLNHRVTYDELKQSLIERNVHVFAWYLPPKLSGISYRGSFAAIFINQDQKEDRRLFTLTHEAVHILCHLRPNHDEHKEIAISVASNRDPQEKEANRLAAELLMPSVMIKKVIDQFGHALKKPAFLDSVAQFFHVSRDALFYRLATDFQIFEWREKNKYLGEFKPQESSHIARVEKITEQVSPEFLQTAMALYSNEEISPAKMAEWLMTTRRTVEDYLNCSESPDSISAVLSGSLDM